MVFNGDANDMDICTLADKPNGTDDTDFPLAEKAMYANWGLREIFKEIFLNYGGWIAGDTNNSGEDTASTNLLNDGSQFYAFATMQLLHAVRWTDDAGESYPLIPITLEEIKEKGYAENEFESTPGRPTYYRPLKNGIKIYPAWDTSKAAVTNGLTVVITKDISPFTPSSTSTSPGYDSLAGHEWLGVFMAMKYADFNTLDTFPGLASSWASGLKGIGKYYAEKFKREHPVRIRKSGSGFVDQFVS